MKKKFLEYFEKYDAIKECIMDYSSPIYIVGIVDELEPLSTTIISALIPSNELIILNKKYPSWLTEIINNSHKVNNLLIIKDFDKITLEKQRLFIDIICKNNISSEELPKNLKIIINAEKECHIIPEIEESVQYFEL